jgi:hypothetical protein
VFEFWARNAQQVVAAATKNQFACIICSRVCECESISGVVLMAQVADMKLVISP